MARGAQVALIRMLSGGGAPAARLCRLPARKHGVYFLDSCQNPTSHGSMAMAQPDVLPAARGDGTRPLGFRDYAFQKLDRMTQIRFCPNLPLPVGILVSSNRN